MNRESQRGEAQAYSFGPYVEISSTMGKYGLIAWQSAFCVSKLLFPLHHSVAVYLTVSNLAAQGPRNRAAKCLTDISEREDGDI